jgi:hypothetical protein
MSTGSLLRFKLTADVVEAVAGTDTFRDDRLNVQFENKCDGRSMDFALKADLALPGLNLR